MNKRINCMQCTHYHVTWDENLPKGCKVYQFKSKTMPSILVQQESGAPCKAFKLNKNLEQKEKKDKSFYDDSYW